MDRNLTGHCILVVEDEPLVLFEVASAFKNAGAEVLTASTLQRGLHLTGHPNLSAAIVDFGLGDSEGGSLCAQLSARRIPFVIYSGYDQVHDECRAGVFVSKPASPDILITTVAQLLGVK